MGFSNFRVPFGFKDFFSNPCLVHSSPTVTFLYLLGDQDPTILVLISIDSFELLNSYEDAVL
jgi:hypothetical protein